VQAAQAGADRQRTGRQLLRIKTLNTNIPLLPYVRALFLLKKKGKSMRVGIGYDSHRLVEGRSLVLGGVKIPHEKGLLGHSDADVLLHAICDAVLGALGEGDIGNHFPDADPFYKDISSLDLLLNVKVLAFKKSYKINNIDSTIILERPRLKEYIYKMIHNISKVLDIEASRVNIKAKTNEGMGFIGQEEGIAAFAIVSITREDV